MLQEWKRSATYMVQRTHVAERNFKLHVIRTTHQFIYKFVIPFRYEYATEANALTSVAQGEWLQGRVGRTRVLLKWKRGKIKANKILNCYKGKELSEATAFEKKKGGGSSLRDKETQIKRVKNNSASPSFSPVLLLHALY